MSETKEVKKENFATVAEAIEGAGTTVLSFLEGNSSRLTVEQVAKEEEDLHTSGKRVLGEHRAYTGPYTDLEDERNAWTAAQEAKEVSRTKELVEDDGDEDEDDDEDDEGNQQAG